MNLKDSKNVISESTQIFSGHFYFTSHFYGRQIFLLRDHLSKDIFPGNITEFSVLENINNSGKYNN